uniref:Uncharacterized protein n=1 Tax=uncultured marine microorganism HF4000_ANIW133B20 TaxID=455528 RepID=B3T3J4_9ZZZZ|nr:hypothetical protein ALOHA_HF4000ANIW133B20ctg2g5 [uncultured marine microorganism HF4000_ANIW133B20]
MPFTATLSFLHIQTPARSPPARRYESGFRDQSAACYRLVHWCLSVQTRPAPNMPRWNWFPYQNRTNRHPHLIKPARQARDCQRRAHPLRLHLLRLPPRWHNRPRPTPTNPEPQGQQFPPLLTTQQHEAHKASTGNHGHP